jgi:hypothetical protein
MRSIKVAERSEKRNVFACSNTVIAVSNPIRGLDVCLKVSVHLLSYVAMPGGTAELTKYIQILSRSTTTDCF